MQIIIGLNAQFVADAMNEIILKTKNTDKKEVFIKAPMKGQLVDIKDVPDTTFSEIMLGNGIAIIPDSGEVYSPFDAVVEQIFDTKHAIVLSGENNVKVLIHIGLDTVKMNGKGFDSLVKEGDKVKLGDLLIKADLNFIKENNYNTITPIVVVNTEDYIEVCAITNKTVNIGDEILKVK